VLHRTGDENNDFFFSEQVLDFIKMVAVDGRSKNRIGPRKVDGRKFNKPGVKKAEHEKVPKKVRVPTGKPRGRPKAKSTEGLGRPKKPEHLLKPKRVPTGKPRGRPKKVKDE